MFPVRRLAAGLALCAAAFCGPTAAASEDLQYPRNLDVPYVPTNQPTVEAMLRVAGVGPADYVIDLGSGDGRIPVTAAQRYGARALGVDLNPRRVAEANERALAAGVTDRVTFRQQNIFDTPIAEATVVTLYLLPDVNLKLRPRLLSELRPGTRVVSHDFTMGEWQADLTLSVRGRGSTVYFWVIPARVAGRWTLRLAHPQGEQRHEVAVKQAFQEIDLAHTAGGKGVLFNDARLEGERIGFTLVDERDPGARYRFEGRVQGDTMEGVAHGEGRALRQPLTWRAVRSGG